MQEVRRRENVPSAAGAGAGAETGAGAKGDVGGETGRKVGQYVCECRREKKDGAMDGWDAGAEGTKRERV
jgi:hypothetical protein